MTTIKTFIPHSWCNREINIEVDSCRWLPAIDIIWLPDNSIKESKERLRSVFRHCDVDIPPNKFIINLAPSDTKKTGSIFDLAIATALLLHIQPVHEEFFSQTMFFWELGLDWSIKTTEGVFAGVLAAMRLWYKQFCIPKECEEQCKYFTTTYPIEHFSQIVNFCLANKPLPTGKQQEFIEWVIVPEKENKKSSFDDIQWHLVAKRGMCIAIAWMHNVLLVWAPWTGKSMLAKASRELLPPLSFEEIIEISYLYSLAGLLNADNPLITNRPFRSIHSSSSKAWLLWWGTNAHPGELSLSHKWVLFLDEVGEFPRDLLDSLRQPLEDKQVHISRVRGKTTYPAECMFVGTSNPCVCGYYADPYHQCRCSINSIKKYQSKLSWPFLDRMDLILQIENQEENIFQNKSTLIGEDKKTMKAKIQKAICIQKERYKDTPYTTNWQVLPKDIEKYMPLSQECQSILQIAVKKFHLSLRAVHKTIRVARTIADYDWVEHIKKQHLLEALQYRSKSWIVKE